MPFPSSPDDRPDPLENMPAMRARIPEHVARGEVSTGVIVVTGGTEYVLDFVRNLPRPNMIVARVVLPHMVMPQFIDALAANVELFRQRYGELPGLPQPATVSHPFQTGPGSSPAGPSNQSLGAQNSGPESSSMDVWPGSSPNPAQSNSPAQPNNPGRFDPTSSGVANTGESNPTPDSMASQAGSQQPTVSNQTNHLRRQNP
ncbi:MAG TPA: DUF3467 domain-containing protein, partial [Pirellula sp.]|nr:DUF3467 domain-containing protein [Pirellula sp.]